MNFARTAMPVNTLMYVGPNIRAASALAKAIKTNVSKVPGAKYFSVSDSVYGRNCLCVEYDKGRRADYQVNRLLKILPADLARRTSPKYLVTISIACMAIRREIELDFKPATLKSIVERQIRLKVIVFPMHKATAYRNYHMKLQRSDLLPEGVG